MVVVTTVSHSLQERTTQNLEGCPVTTLTVFMTLTFDLSNDTFYLHILLINPFPNNKF